MGRPNPGRYRLRTVWTLDAEPETVFRILERAEDYPRWWPQVREVRRRQPGHPGGDDGTDATGTVVFRSVLPYRLRITAHRARRDPRAGVLEIAMSGSLEGWARWTIRPDATGRRPRTRAILEQDVVVRGPLMRLFAMPCRPLFLANHAAMMRGGRRGLRALLRSAAAAPPSEPV